MMDFENQNDMSWGKILTRRSSLGCSSRISYYRSGGGVPFQWEMQPGIAKEAPKEELPPLTPPPAILSKRLPKPCIMDPEPSIGMSRFWFWKKMVKRGKSKRPHRDCFDEDVIGIDMSGASSDSESMVSPRGSSCSSSSSSLSFMKGHPSSESPTKQVYGRSLALGCLPLHVSRVVVSVARRD